MPVAPVYGWYAPVDNALVLEVLPLSPDSKVIHAMVWLPTQVTVRA